MAGAGGAGQDKPVLPPAPGPKLIATPGKEWLIRVADRMAPANTDKYRPWRHPPDNWIPQQPSSLVRVRPDYTPLDGAVLATADIFGAPRVVYSGDEVYARVGGTGRQQTVGAAGGAGSPAKPGAAHISLPAAAGARGGVHSAPGTGLRPGSGPPGAPSYAIKYFGVSHGQLGVLSVRKALGAAARDGPKVAVSPPGTKPPRRPYGGSSSARRSPLTSQTPLVVPTTGTRPGSGSRQPSGAASASGRPGSAADRPGSAAAARPPSARPSRPSSGLSTGAPTELPARKADAWAGPWSPWEDSGPTGGGLLQQPELIWVPGNFLGGFALRSHQRGPMPHTLRPGSAAAAAAAAAAARPTSSGSARGGSASGRMGPPPAEDGAADWASPEIPIGITAYVGQHGPLGRKTSAKAVRRPLPPRVRDFLAEAGQRPGSGGSPDRGYGGGGGGATFRSSSDSLGGWGLSTLEGRGNTSSGDLSLEGLPLQGSPRGAGPRSHY